MLRLRGGMCVPAHYTDVLERTLKTGICCLEAFILPG